MKHCERSQICDSSIMVAIEGHEIDFSVDLCRNGGWFQNNSGDDCVHMARRCAFLEALTSLDAASQMDTSRPLFLSNFH